ncbi:MAG: AAA family ATPase, partial [Desulfobacterales bacterium]|nr:AAA family ATPase [Desulfobacterales bacterium]
MTESVTFDNNPELLMVDAFVRHTGANIFLTGKAGTGKTTFLTGLKSDCHKQIMVTAPTGVAAINAGGVTLHSFFQLPFGPYIPGQTDQRRDFQRFFRFSKEKKRIIKGLDLLIIDEISMVRADLLDSVDAVLRRLRRNDRPFGGVQLLLIGDLFQLPPVVKQDEWQLLQDNYPSMYFFASQALARTELVSIELKKIYRQSDQGFIDLLNAVRENRLEGETAEVLNRCAEKPVPERGAITLTTHNRKADDINRERLARLDEETVSI